MGKIIVEAPAPLASGEQRETVAGVIGVNPSKPEFGSIQMRSTEFNLSGGFMSQVKKVHFMAGRIEDLTKFVTETGITPGCDLNQKLTVKGMPQMAIRVTESETPSYEGQQQKVNPTTGEIMTSGGKPVFRNTELVSMEEYKGDRLLENDKSSNAVTTNAHTTMRISNPLERD